MSRFLNVQEVINIHDLLIIKHGGLMGLRDLGLLILAVKTTKIQIDKKFLHCTIYEQAAAYLFHICKNHPFIDGNKRTAAASSLIFLEDNEIELKLNVDEFEHMVVKTAKGHISKKQISLFFEQSQC